MFSPFQSRLQAVKGSDIASSIYYFVEFDDLDPDEAFK